MSRFISTLSTLFALNLTRHLTSWLESALVPKSVGLSMFPIHSVYLEYQLWNFLEELEHLILSFILHFIEIKLISQSYFLDK